jgi:hypothetical protein
LALIILSQVRNCDQSLFKNPRQRQAIRETRSSCGCWRRLPVVSSSTNASNQTWIAVKSTIPTSDVIACFGLASTFDSSGRTMEESAGVAATRGASTAACTVTIPYSWPLASPSTDMVNLSFTINAPVAGTSGLPNRMSTQTFATIHCPRKRLDNHRGYQRNNLVLENA